MPTGTYPKIGIARMGHQGDIHDCRCGFVRMGYTDWDLISEPTENKSYISSQDNIDKKSYISSRDLVDKKTDNYVNSPDRLN